MTWAFFSDVHGNREALEAVIADFPRQGVTRSFFLGDAVGYGASPNECVELIRAHAEVCLLGNHDEAVVKPGPLDDFNAFARAGIVWTRAALTAQSRAEIAAFLMEYREPDLRLAHASPDAPEQWTYVLEPFAAELAFAGFAEPLCLIGHTHQPLMFRKSGAAPCAAFLSEETILQKQTRLLVNAGSVGQPRDGDPRACYVVYDPETARVRYRRVPYDVSAAQERIRQADLPAFLAVRLELGR